MRTRYLLRIGSVSVVLLLVGAVAPGVAAAKAKAPSASTLKTLEKNLANTKHLTYEAVYKSVSGSTTSTVTIAQAPPKSNFSSSGGEVINTGKSTYYCSVESGTTSCLSAGGSNPLLGLEDLFSPSAAIAAFSEIKTGLLSRLAGIKATASSATIAGQSSTCVTVSVHGQGGKYCVTKKGILSYAGATSGSYFELTKSSSSPPASLFSLPSGATTVTLPTGDHPAPESEHVP